MSLAFIVTLHGEVLNMRHGCTLQALQDDGPTCARQLVTKAADMHVFESVRHVIFVVETAKGKGLSLESRMFSGDDLNLNYWRVFRLQFVVRDDKRSRQLNEVFRAFSRKACEDWIKKCGLEAKELHTIFDDGGGIN